MQIVLLWWIDGQIQFIRLKQICPSELCEYRLRPFPKLYATKGVLHRAKSDIQKAGMGFRSITRNSHADRLVMIAEEKNLQVLANLVKDEYWLKVNYFTCTQDLRLP